MFASFCLFPRNRQTDDYLSQSYNFFRRFDKFFAPFDLAERQDVGRLVFASIRVIQRPHSFPADQRQTHFRFLAPSQAEGFFYLLKRRFRRLLKTLLFNPCFGKIINFNHPNLAISSFTILLTAPPSARPFVSLISAAITFPKSFSLLAPDFAIASLTFALNSSSLICAGKYAISISSSDFSLAASSGLPPFSNCSLASLRFFASLEITPSNSSSVNSPSRPVFSPVRFSIFLLSLPGV